MSGLMDSVNQSCFGLTTPQKLTELPSVNFCPPKGGVGVWRFVFILYFQKSLDKISLICYTVFKFDQLAFGGTLM